jgi:TRAP-type C4-dicarboxylate transport system permease small subunit
MSRVPATAGTAVFRRRSEKPPSSRSKPESASLIFPGLRFAEMKVFDSISVSLHKKLLKHIVPFFGSWHMTKILDAASYALERIGLIVATTILSAVFILVLFGIVFRFTNIRFAMYEELARWGLVGMTFIGASVALKRKQHVGINMLVQALPLAVAKTCIVAAYLVIMITLAVAMYFSFRAAFGAAGITGDIVPLPMMYIKLTLPIGMIMMLVHLLAGFAKVFKARDIDSVLIGS